MGQSVGTTSSEKSNQFAVSLLAFWVHGKMYADEKTFHVNMPNTSFFGLIPTGSDISQTPIDKVSNVVVSKSYKLGSMFLGIILALVGIFTLTSSPFLGSPFLGIILLLIGVLLFLGGIKTSFQFERSMAKNVIEVPFFEANHVSELAEELNSEMEKRTDDTNMAASTDRSIANADKNGQAIINAFPIKDNRVTTAELSLLKKQLFVLTVVNQ